ncbi:hypothetical protein FACS1894184_04980 [Clostridia bacterium]|nr:hypothetical protein FACS1894184_04980 [Clostridia bacterium]
MRRWIIMKHILCSILASMLLAFTSAAAESFDAEESSDTAEPLTGSVSIANERAYQTAVDQYNQGSLDEAYLILKQMFDGGDYKQSRQYLHYIDAQQAVADSAYKDAIDLLTPLARESFLDTAIYLRYIKGLAAEASSDILRAVLYYKRLGMEYDALSRLISLQISYPSYFLTDLDLPSGASVGCEAVVMREHIPTFLQLGQEQTASFELHGRVRVIAFSFGPYDALYACVVPVDAPGFDDLDSDIGGDIFFIPADALYYSRPTLE